MNCPEVSANELTSGCHHISTSKFKSREPLLIAVNNLQLSKLSKRIPDYPVPLHDLCQAKASSSTFDIDAFTSICHLCHFLELQSSLHQMSLHATSGFETIHFCVKIPLKAHRYKASAP